MYEKRKKLFFLIKPVKKKNEFSQTLLDTVVLQNVFKIKIKY